MEKLQQQLDELLSHLKEEKDVRGRLATLLSVYPINRFKYLISILLGKGVLSLDSYYELRDEYVARNLYLYIFEISGPRTFGEAWAQGHLKELVPELAKPSKKLDSNYTGEDVIRHWVLSAREVESNKFYSSGQHRGNVGEGQLHLNQENIGEFAKFEAKGPNLAEAIRAAYSRQMAGKKEET